MVSEQSWKIAGYEGRSVSNRVFSFGESNERLAVMLPGYAYSIAAPLFHYGGQLLSSLGFDLLAVDYRYNENREFRAASDDQRKRWFAFDVHAVYESVLGRARYKRLLFFGKSMGTIAMLDIIERPLPWEKTGFVWLTPAAAEGELLRALRRHAVPSLVVVGSKDHFYRQEEIEQLSALRHVDTKVVEGADHGMEYPDQPLRSVRVLPEILDSIAQFVEGTTTD